MEQCDSDVNKRKTSQQVLLKSEARISALTRSIQDAVISMDPDLLISFRNPATNGGPPQGWTLNRNGIAYFGNLFSRWVACDR
jgi:hypothetical protein